ncbi:hypothetical protein BX600DRAFT_442869 [Xylariales sp. PMI_506]|nr:hypothetical protein BX600DRAFT_442869 [Xylariales sp. PMI_506]
MNPEVGIAVSGAGREKGGLLSPKSEAVAKTGPSRVFPFGPLESPRAAAGKTVPLRIRLTGKGSGHNTARDGQFMRPRNAASIESNVHNAPMGRPGLPIRTLCRVLRYTPIRPEEPRSGSIGSTRSGGKDSGPSEPLQKSQPLQHLRAGNPPQDDSSLGGDGDDRDHCQRRQIWLLPIDRRKCGETRQAAAVCEVHWDVAEPFMLAVRRRRARPEGDEQQLLLPLQVGGDDDEVKLVWCFMAVLLHAELGEEKGEPETQFEPTFLGVDQAMARLTFQKDRYVLKKAAELVI